MFCLFTIVVILVLVGTVIYLALRTTPSSNTPVFNRNPFNISSGVTYSVSFNGPDGTECANFHSTHSTYENTTFAINEGQFEYFEKGSGVDFVGLHFIELCSDQPLAFQTGTVTINEITYNFNTVYVYSDGTEFYLKLDSKV